MSRRDELGRFGSIRPSSAQYAHRTIVPFASPPRTSRSERKNGKALNVQVPSIPYRIHTTSFTSAGEMQSDNSFDDFLGRQGSSHGENIHRHPSADYIGDLLDRQRDSNHTRISSSVPPRLKKRSPKNSMKHEVRFGDLLPSRPSSQNGYIETVNERTKIPSPKSFSTADSKSELRSARSLDEPSGNSESGLLGPGTCSQDEQRGDTSKIPSLRIGKAVPFLSRKTRQRVMTPQAWRLLHRTREKPKMHVRCPGQNTSKLWKHIVKLAPDNEASRPSPGRWNQNQSFSAEIHGKPVARMPSAKSMTRVHSQAAEYLAAPESITSRRNRHRLNPNRISDTAHRVGYEDTSKRELQRRNALSSQAHSNPTSFRDRNRPRYPQQHPSRMSPPPVKLPQVMLAKTIFFEPFDTRRSAFDTRRSDSFKRSSFRSSR
mmetsp:Transcript_14276/g.27162  ORF Transcript_14276/g.27162 Transcript_14276/m.27162 type:complete len:431 (+) Transcript_14276:133-1425(+)